VEYTTTLKPYERCPDQTLPTLHSTKKTLIPDGRWLLFCYWSRSKYVGQSNSFGSICMKGLRVSRKLCKRDEQNGFYGIYARCSLKPLQKEIKVPVQIWSWLTTSHRPITGTQTVREINNPRLAKQLIMGPKNRHLCVNWTYLYCSNWSFHREKNMNRWM
jgi:hypothetical protein